MLVNNSTEPEISAHNNWGPNRKRDFESVIVTVNRQELQHMYIDKPSNHVRGSIYTSSAVFHRDTSEFRVRARHFHVRC